jgi:lipopolysaccharide heptosyltransferase II
VRSSGATTAPFTTAREAMAVGRTPAQRVRLAGLRLAGSFYSGNRSGPGKVAPRSVLLIRPDHLGDLLFLTPALHALRLALPGIRLTLLAGPWGIDAVRENPDLDEIRVCRFPGFERRPKASALEPYRLLRNTAAELRPAGYDVAVVLRNDHWWGAWLAAEAHIPRRLGYDWPETRPFLTHAAAYDACRHEVEQNARLLAKLAPGVSEDPGPLQYSIAPADRTWAAKWLLEQGVDPARPLVAIHPGAGAAVKQWPPEAWGAVADGLAEDGAQVLLTGGPSETGLAQSVAASMIRGAVNAAGQTTLGQLAALEARCALVLGSDSGPLHLAVAAGAPTLHLYGPVPAAKFGPWGAAERQRVLISPWACVPCNRLDWSAGALGYHRCMGAIDPQAVLAAAREILAEYACS